MMRWTAQAVKTSLSEELWNNRKHWLLLTLAFAVGYHLLLMASLIVRFGDLPNYIVFYNWFKNVWVIVQSTPSWRDMLPIINEEWLVEIGYMNYDFGNGISEWSLSLQPPKVLIVLCFSALIAANILLLRSSRKECSTRTVSSASAATGLGAILVGMTSATMSWVVCCATPTWVVGLAMLGVGVSTSLWLEPLGIWLTTGGFALLAITTLFIAGYVHSDSERLAPSNQTAGVL